MSIVASPSRASTLPAEIPCQAHCPGCGSPLSTEDSGTIPSCTTCRRSYAEHEAMRLLGEVRDLANGTGVYADVPEDERKEQIRALVLSTDDGKPADKTPEQALTDLVNVLPESSIALLADLVSRRIADRKRQRRGGAPTLIRVAIADLCDSALIELVGETEDPVLLNAASAELAGRLGPSAGEEPRPLFTQAANATPDPVTRYDLEGRIDAICEPAERIMERLAKAA